jgi:hypothetical protein
MTPLLEDTSHSELPPAVGIPQAELGLYPTPALADLNPLVELGQPAVEPRRSELPYGWESWNTKWPVEVDSSNLAELAQPASAPDVYGPEPQGDFSQPHKPDIHNLLLNRIQPHQAVKYQYQHEQQKMKN